MSFSMNAPILQTVQPVLLNFSQLLIITNKMSKILKNFHVITKNLQATLKTVQNDIKPVITNRNPRNLEKLRIGYKPDGFHLEKPGNRFWHKLRLSVTGRYVTATVEHFENGTVLSASTKEWAIQKHLYRNSDTSAYINLGRVLAQRCLESGLTEIRCDIVPENEGKVSSFLKELRDGGVTLSEPEQYKAVQPWDRHRPDKPWEVSE